MINVNLFCKKPVLGASKQYRNAFFLKCKNGTIKEQSLLLLSGRIAMWGRISFQIGATNNKVIYQITDHSWGTRCDQPLAVRWQGNCRPKGWRERVAERHSQRPCGHPGGSRWPSLPGLRCPALRSPDRGLAQPGPPLREVLPDQPLRLLRRESGESGGPGGRRIEAVICSSGSCHI